MRSFWQRRDPWLRGAGAALLVLSVSCFAWLFHGAAGAARAPGWVEASAATLAFLGASLGVTLLLLGRHIHDPVSVSPRWRRMAAREGAGTGRVATGAVDRARKPAGRRAEEGARADDRSLTPAWAAVRG